MQPSTREGFGLVITEALWKGKPVIASDVGAIPLQVIDGDTGYFYQSAHWTAQKVNYLLENPQAAEIMGRRGKKCVESHFLLTDRIVDYLMGINMTVNKTIDREIYTDCIISFHPWFKLTRWRRNPPPSDGWAW
jgi:trehalose synthase